MPRFKEKLEWFLDPANQERYGFTTRHHPDAPTTHEQIIFNDDSQYWVCNRFRNSDYYDYSHGLSSKLLSLGYTFTLTDQDRKDYLTGKDHYPQLDQWLKEKFSEFKSEKAFRSYINKTFGVRGRIDFHNGEPYATEWYRIEPVWSDEHGFVYKILKKSEMDLQSKTIKGQTYFIETGCKYYDISGSYYTLLELFLLDLEDVEECQEHPGNFYFISQGCPVCNAQFKIQSYSTNALDTFKFKKKETEKNPLYLGIELEFDTDRKKAPPLIRRFKDHMIAKEDGSIDGFELVTAPATFSIHAEIFKEFPFNKQKVTSRDGMHVHVDKKSLTTLQMGKIFEFIYNDNNYKFIKKIAGRDLNNYCSTVTKKSVLSGIEEHENGITYRVEGSHHTAINVSNKNTVEFRIFRTPSTYEQFMARLEFVKAMVDWTKPGQVPYGINGFKEEKNFLNYVTDCRKVYPNLFKEII